jgi:hypothetical protein
MEVYSLEPSGPIDMTMRLVMILALVGWNVLEGLSLRTPYPITMVALWSSPVWRFVLLLAIWLGAEWCPRVGLMTALAVVLYVVNMVQIVN